MKNIIVKDPGFRGEIEKMMDPPVSITVTKFDQESVDKFAEAMSRAHNTGQKIIPIIVDTYGGGVYELLSMIEEIKNSKIPVATIAMGKAMSAGAVLLTCGQTGHRYMSPRSVVMIHDVTSVTWGKTEEIKADAKETERLQELLFHLMADNCGYKDKEFFSKIIHERSHAEWYLTPAEAKKYKIVQHIKVPSFTTTIKLETTFG